MNRTLEETREMKGSGIEWIGLIPKEWEVRKLDSISKTITDFVASGSFAALRENVEYKDEPDYAMLVRTVDLSNNFNNSNIYITKKSYEFLSNSNLYGGELILSNIGSVGNVYYFQPKYKRNSLASNSIMVITNYCNKFYYYWFLSPLGNQSLINLSNSAVQMKFNKTQLRALRVPLPPLHEQQAIANYLDEKVGKIDELIAEQNQAIENWKAYKQSLITETVTKGLNPDVEMKDSGIEWIGEIPKEWEVKKSKYLINFRTGLSITKKDFVESGYKTINYGQIHSKYTFDLDLTRDDLFKVSFDYAQSNPLAILKKGDFVFCDTSEDLNGCGNCVLVENTNEEVLLAGSHTTIGRLKEKSVPRYMAYLFKSDKVRAQIRANVVGIKVFSITQKILNNTFLIIPPLYEQQQIADYLDEKCLKIDETVEQKQVLIKQLEEYKQSLIYECVTGKRCVL